jgi:hypothetical protein
LLIESKNLKNEDIAFGVESSFEKYPELSAASEEK